MSYFPADFLSTLFAPSADEATRRKPARTETTEAESLLAELRCMPFLRSVKRNLKGDSRGELFTSRYLESIKNSETGSRERASESDPRDRDRRRKAGEGGRPPGVNRIVPGEQGAMRKTESLQISNRPPKAESARVSSS